MLKIFSNTLEKSTRLFQNKKKYPIIKNKYGQGQFAKCF